MSNEELFKLAGIRPQSMKNDYSAMSDEELLKIAGLENEPEYSIANRAAQLVHGAKAGLMSPVFLMNKEEQLKEKNKNIVRPNQRWDPLQLSVEQQEERNLSQNKNKEYLTQKEKELSTPLGRDMLARIIHHTGELAGASVLPVPGNGALKSVGKFAKQIGVGGAMGAGSGLLQEAGVNPLVADVLATTSPLTAGVTKLGYQSIRNKAQGLAPKHLNIPLYETAQRHGIELPNAVVSKSKSGALLNQFGSKLPIVGSKLEEVTQKARSRFKNELDKLKNEIGPLSSETRNEEISSLYDLSRETLPVGAAVNPINTVKTINKEIAKIRKSDITSTEREAIVQQLLDFKKIVQPPIKVNGQTIGNATNHPYEVERLIKSKQVLNKSIDWNKIEDAKEARKHLLHAMNKDIETYGHSSKEAKDWFKTYKQADTEFAKTAKREQFENLVASSTDKIDDDLIKYGQFANKLKDKKNQKLLSNIFGIKKGEENIQFKKLEDLSDIAAAWVNSGRRLPNPSGTAPTDHAWKFTVGLLTTVGAQVGIGNIPGALKTLGGTALSIGLLRRATTNPKVLKAAINFAKKPSDTLARRLNFIAKEQMGVNLNTINHKIQDNEDD